MNNNSFRPVAVIIVIVLGIIIFKHFDFSSLTFKKPVLDIIYIITVSVLLYLLFKNKPHKK